MNSILNKHRPKDMDPKKWDELWRNSHTILRPLFLTLKDMQKGKGAISSADFDTPNHYAKLVAELVEHQTLDKVMELLPDTAKD